MQPADPEAACRSLHYLDGTTCGTGGGGAGGRAHLPAARTLHVPVGRLALAERVPRRDVRTRTQLFVADVAVVRVRAHAEVVQRARRVRGGIPVITLLARDIGAVADVSISVRPGSVVEFINPFSRPISCEPNVTFCSSVMSL